MYSLFVTQYDDFEDSDGVTSEGEGLHNLLKMSGFYHPLFYFAFNHQQHPRSCFVLNLLYLACVPGGVKGVSKDSLASFIQFSSDLNEQNKKEL